MIKHRTTPQRKAPWCASKPVTPKARKPVRRVSKVTAKRNRDYAKVKREFLKRNPFCQVCLESGRPMKFSDTAHHIKPRSVSPELVCEPGNLLSCCDSCHAEIHNNPTWARARGFLKRSTDE